MPQLLINRGAADLSDGSCGAVSVSGTEAWRSRVAARRAGLKLVWTFQAEDRRPTRMVEGRLDVLHAADEPRAFNAFRECCDPHL